MKNLPIQIKIILVFLLIIVSSALISNLAAIIYYPTVELFNSAKQYSLNYDRATQEQISNYDGYYQAFMGKQTNANINKETFLIVTDIIMSNRKDGQSLSWKWVHENQQIPYHEFTNFYKDLSEFIEVRYADNMKIEREKQRIVQEHNLLLIKYPNNIINKWLNIKPLTYKHGFISDSTLNKFK